MCKEHPTTSVRLLCLQGRETVINMPPAARQKPKQKSAAGTPRQSLLGSMGWALGTGVGMIYLATILCLCAWPCVHFIVQLAQHTNIVSLTQLYLAWTTLAAFCHCLTADG